MKKKFLLLFVGMIMCSMALFAQGQITEPNGLNISFRKDSKEVNCLFTSLPKITYENDGATLVLSYDKKVERYATADIEKMVFLSISEEAVGIERIADLNGNSVVVYDTAGRRIQDVRNAHGIVIIDGKKVLIKNK